MSVVNFKVVNHENRVFNVSLDNTINDLRRMFAKDLFGSTKYVDILCIMKTPIRGFGKMTLEPGIIPASFNDSRLNRFNLEGREITINVTELNKENNEDNSTSSGESWAGKAKQAYIPPSLSLGGRKKVEKEYVYKEDDFPPLC